MIIGIGIDLIDVQRFERRRSDELVAEVFLPAEAAYARTQAHPQEALAARFAAKEAAFKALGAGLAQGLRWRDVEVVRDPAGPVSLRLHGAAAARAADLGVTGSFVSLSHTRTGAVAVVVLEGDRP